MQDFGVNEKVVVLGDLNARVVCIAIPFIIYKFIVNGVNDSGERLIEMGSVCGMAVGNTYFDKRRIHKYMWGGTKGVARKKVFGGGHPLFITVLLGGWRAERAYSAGRIFFEVQLNSSQFEA